MSANAKAIQALVNRGADAMDNMYDVKIQFPWADSGSIVTTRIDGFNVPEAHLHLMQLMLSMANLLTGI